MIDINGIQIIGTFSSSGKAGDIYKCLKTLYTTPAGTVPFDREFGIDFSIVDSPANVAKARLTVEYIEKTRRYEPRASVQEVTFLVDGESGSIYPRVVIEI